MAMEIREHIGRRVFLRFVARQFAAALIVACVVGLACGQVANAPAAGQSQGSQPAQPPQAQDEGSSSSVHHKKTSGSVHHTTVEEEVAPAPELAQAEDLIQKQKFATAEPLLRKVVGDDPANYVAWFDLGFVENGLGKREDSIAAYRKSVAAKPDVFESNLNLGLQLAKAGQPDAEQYLRAATQLKPTSHVVAEGQARAWVSLAHVLEAGKPEEAIAAYQKAAALQPKDPEPHLSAGLLAGKATEVCRGGKRVQAGALALGSSADGVRPMR
jgi:tetratricopeptide (TPR) repeat protein